MSVFSGVRKKILVWFIKGVITDVQKGRYGAMFEKAWKWLDGRKTAIGLLITFSIDLIPRVAALINAFGGDSSQFVAVGGELTLILGALHKILKGN
jgi:hypothetical protein